MEVECVKVSKQPHPPSESWGPAGHRGTVPNHETWAVIRPHSATRLPTWNAVSLTFFCIRLSSPHHAEYYLHEAKRMKHRADAMVSPPSLTERWDVAAICFVTQQKVEKSFISVCSVQQANKTLFTEDVCFQRASRRNVHYTFWYFDILIFYTWPGWRRTYSSSQKMVLDVFSLV